ncbi:MAG: nicotinate-nucleotide adenylyltransferase [Gammaproteobacteria bacterium]|nr:nicotinate-nucleotide adenylyltransferase [Gammaproteobacteria bacterium]
MGRSPLTAVKALTGVMGGTFDPIHHGHLRIAVELCQKLQLEECLLLPSATPPHRPAPLATATERLEMLTLALEERVCEDSLTNLRVDGRELQRSGPSYTITTVDALRGEMGEECALVLLLGSDAFLQFHTWHRWQELRQRVHIAVAHRPGYPLDLQQMAPPLAAWFLEAAANDPMQLRQQRGGKVVTVEVTPLAISSSTIRTMLSRGESIRFLTPHPVWRYINQNGIYRR